MLLCPCRNICS